MRATRMDDARRAPYSPALTLVKGEVATITCGVFDRVAFVLAETVQSPHADPPPYRAPAGVPRARRLAGVPRGGGAAAAPAGGARRRAVLVRVGASGAALRRGEAP